MATNLARIMLVAGTGMALAVSANAEINWSGYGGLSSGLGTSTYSSQNCWLPSCGTYRTHDSRSLWALAGDVHVSTVFDSGLSFQFDAEGNRSFFDGLTSLYYPNIGRVTKYGMGVHIDTTGDQYRVGEFVSIGNSDWANTNNRLVSAGLEGEWLFDRTTLFSQLVYSHAVQGTFFESGLNSWYLYTGARYFLSDNLMFEADTGAGTIESASIRFPYVGTSDNGNILHWSAKAEYRFQGLPVSLLINYQGSYATWKSYNAYWEGIPCGHGALAYERISATTRRTGNLFMLSLHYYLGQDSLLANDRNGAGMNDYNPWYGAEPITEAFMGNPNYGTLIFGAPLSSEQC